MGLVYSETNGGRLLLAEYGMEAAAVSRMLTEHDRRLELQLELDPTHGRFVAKVYARYAADRPPVWICDWRDDQGVPLPLSSRLLDRVKQLDMATRSVAPDADRLNEERQRRLAKDAATAYQDLAADHANPRNRIACLKPGRGLQMARMRERRKSQP